MWRTSKKVIAEKETLDSSVLFPFQWQASGGKSPDEGRPSGCETIIRISLKNTHEILGRGQKPQSTDEMIRKRGSFCDAF